MQRPGGERDMLADPWIAAIALLLAGGIGIAIGRGRSVAHRS
jgi:hypothetical protein